MPGNKPFWKRLLPFLVIATLVTISITLVVFSSSKTEKESLRITEKKNPQVRVDEDYVSAVRRIFQEYSSGNIENITDTAIEGLGEDNSGFQSIPKEYFTSTFEVKNIRNGVAGGKEMLISFNSAPDKTIWVWVYQLAGGSYQIRGIQQKLSPTAP